MHRAHPRTWPSDLMIMEWPDRPGRIALALLVGTPLAVGEMLFHQLHRAACWAEHWCTRRLNRVIDWRHGK